MEAKKMKTSMIFINLFTWLNLFGLGGNAAFAGSLYQPENYRPLTADHKIYIPGDLITVMIFENASATTGANTNIGRDARVEADLQGSGRGTNLGVTTNNQTDGRGRTQRQGQVLAQITVSVKSVLENGDLLIGGEQLLEVNNEKQQIKLQGRIRVGDISGTNTILSTRIAEAKISYVGEGDVSDKQRPSWWQRALSWFGV
jgi:flagellar L-ring protein FlgH